MNLNTAVRLGLKFIQFAVSFFLIFSVSKVGPHWLLLVCILILPPFGTYLVLRPVPVPPETDALTRLRIARRSLRVEAVLAASMATLCAALAGIFAFAHHSMSPPPRPLLNACVSAAALCLLYSLDVFVIFLRLRSATAFSSSSPPLSSPLSLTIDSFPHSCYAPSGSRLLSIDGIKKSYGPPSVIESVSIPRISTSRLRAAPRFASPPPRPAALPVADGRHAANFRARLPQAPPPPPTTGHGHRRRESEHGMRVAPFYCLPPSSPSPRPPSSLSSCSIHLGDGYTSNSTLSQENTSAFGQITTRVLLNESSPDVGKAEPVVLKMDTRGSDC